MPPTLVLSAPTKQAIQIAQALAKESQNAQFTPGHLLHALLHRDIGLRELLETLGQDVPYLQEWAEVRIENLSKNTQIPEAPAGDAKVSATLEEADLIRLKLNEEEITPLALLAALAKPNVAFTADQLKTFPPRADDLLATVVAEQAIQDAIAAPSGNGSAQQSAATKSKALFKYCVDRTSLAREGKTDPIIGRDRETRMMVEILGRRTKPNVLIIGEPGVGKTALVDGFAQDIVAQRVPRHLAPAVLFELDLGALVAGAAYKGEVEDRLKSIIKEVKGYDKAILFIDELHLLLDPKGPVGTGAANLLKPELARGEITVIGATTLEEYRKFIEKEEAFNRRFETLRVDEPDLMVAERMVRTLVQRYEQHHALTVDSEAPKEAVQLAHRYIKDRRLPDSAIDLLDRTMAAIRMADETSEARLAALRERLSELTQEELSLDELRWFERELHHQISPILISQLPDTLTETEPDTPEALSQHLQAIIEQLQAFTQQKKGSVNPADIAAMVAHKTGIPLGKIQTREREKLLAMDEHLRQRVVGQDHATRVIADAVLESRSGLVKPGQPIGSFFFLGPTGTGKTELAKSLAEFLFDDESTLLRFDMSEFKEAHSAAVLLGAPAGYVGYEAGGVLVNKIREKPYAVVLFDEIEKAHASVFDIFLQIMDEGKLHDRLGKEGDFSNAVILFTSNIGSRHIMDAVAAGALPSSAELMEVMSGHFRPEFLARVTELVPFAPIQEENVVKIFNIHLKKLLHQLNKQGIELKISEAATEQLARSGYTPEYGARPLTGVIRNQLRRPLSRLIIGEEVKSGSVVSLDVDEEKNLVWSY